MAVGWLLGDLLTFWEESRLTPQRRPQKRMPWETTSTAAERGREVVFLERGVCCALHTGGQPVRPNGPGDSSPGMRPKAIPWVSGRRSHGGLKGRGSPP